MKRAEVLTQSIAAPLKNDRQMPDSFVTSRAETSETEKRMLLIRLSEASGRIRKESDLIRRTGFTEPSGRLLRILAETVEEQLIALDGKTK